MAKYSGTVGFVTMTEITPGVWEEGPSERPYYGDILENRRRLQSSDKVNDGVEISNRISIVADPFLRQNFHTIRYATYNGVKWKISSIEVQFPRLILTLGGIYHVE